MPEAQLQSPAPSVITGFLQRDYVGLGIVYLLSTYCGISECGWKESRSLASWVRFLSLECELFRSPVR